MQLDIRLPIGLLFAIIGIILVGFGAYSHFQPPEIYQKIYEPSLGINVNICWGSALVIFGGVMLALAWRARGDEKRK